MLMIADLVESFCLAFIAGPKNLDMNTIGKLFALIVFKSSASDDL